MSPVRPSFQQRVVGSVASAGVVVALMPFAPMTAASAATAPADNCLGAQVVSSVGATVCQARFTTSGVWTVPKGVTMADVVVVGGGGGGSGAKRVGSEWTAGSGGGGGYVLVESRVAVSGAVNVVVGAGGSAGSSSTEAGVPIGGGGDGETSAFGLLVAPGGGAGEATVLVGRGHSPAGRGGGSGRIVEGNAQTFSPGGTPFLFVSPGGPIHTLGGGGYGAGGPAAGVARGEQYTAPTVNGWQRDTYSWDPGSGGNGFQPTQGLFSVAPVGAFGGGAAGGSSSAGGYTSKGGHGGGGNSSWTNSPGNGAAHTGGGGGGASISSPTRNVYAPTTAGAGGSGVVLVRWAAPPAISTSELREAQSGETYSLRLAATGQSPFTWSIAKGDLPEGLTLTKDGLIAGTAVSDVPKVSTFTVMVTDARGGTDARELTLAVLVPLAIVTETVPLGSVDDTYLPTTLVASGASDNAVWAATGLPKGLSVSPSGVLSGTPAEAGEFEVTLLVTDKLATGPTAGTTSPATQESVRSDKALIVVGIDEPAGLEIDAAAGLPVGTEDEPYEAPFDAAGGASPYRWSVVGGTLPSGLSLSSGGLVSGTPTEAGTFPVSVRVTDAKSTTTTLKVDVVIQPLEVTGSSVPICHRTADGYELVVTTDAVFDGRGEHGDHGGDIVPNIVRLGGGRNWDAEGMALFFNGCEPTTEEAVDTDDDGLADAVDADDDGDGIADVADEDQDGDGTANDDDADYDPFPDQDGDGLADALDPDDDGDCIVDARDTDRDGDGILDEVDEDLDNDGIENSDDVDMDGDGQPNLLDGDVDGDTVSNGDGDTIANEEQAERDRRTRMAEATCPTDRDPDGDGVPSVKDLDDDGDGIPDVRDRVVARPWVDTDGDGVVNSADTDVDGDGTPNEADPDVDGDGVEDSRDADANADGIVELRAQPLRTPYRLPVLVQGRAVSLATGSLTTVAGQEAAIKVQCRGVAYRSRPVGDVGAPDATRRCLVTKDGDGPRLLVFNGPGPTKVKVRIWAPAVDDYRPQSTVVSVTVR